MKDTIQVLKDFASNGDNAWMICKLELLEAQIDYALIQQEIKTFNEFNRYNIKE
jgi:hypothetical protein